MSEVLAQIPPSAPDASNGFHDIKMLPNFAPYIPYLLIALASLALLAIVIAFIIKKSKGLPVPNASPGLPPNLKALGEIHELKNRRRKNTIGIRELGSRLSLAIRLFVEERLNFPASDMTLSEFKSAFPEFLKMHIPERTLRGTLESTVNELLEFCREVVFSEAAEMLYPPESRAIEAHLEKAEEFVRLLEKHMEEREKKDILSSNETSKDTIS